MKNSPQICATCGEEIPPSSMGSMCPGCLLGGIWEDDAAKANVLFSLPGHEVLSELGRGGMGIVYLARQFDPSREVALKMLLPSQGISAEMRERFRLEAATVAALDHPHILPVYATGEHDGLPWFTLKLAGGGSLAERMGEFHGRWRASAELLATLAEAVHFAHQRGALHRDLKPGNIIFDELGTAYVSDFGLAKWISGARSTVHSLTMDGSMMGTPHYLSPEAAKMGTSAATASSDVYALGAILYEMLTGRPPFTAESTPELMRCVYEDAAVPPCRLNPEVPRDLSAVAMKCLEKSPALRYESAAALAADLRSWLAGRGVQARPVSGLVRLGRWARRNPALAGTAAVLIVVLAGAAVLLMQSNQRMRAALAESLLSQARMTSTGSVAGTRNAALQLLRQGDLNGAAGIPDLAARRRTEITHALALPELSQAQVWTAPSASSLGAESFSPDLERYLATTSDGGFALHETQTRRVLKAWPPAEAERAARALSPAVRLRLSTNEKLAAVIFAGDSSAPSHLRIVSLENGRTLGEWPCTNLSPEWPLWLADGGFLFANSLTPCLRADAGGSMLTPFPDPERSADTLPLALAPDGNNVVVAMKSSKTLARLSLADRREIWRTPLLELPGPVAWSADDKMLAIGERTPATLPGETKSATAGCGLILLDAASGAFRCELPGHAMPVAEVCFLQGGKSVASMSSEQGLVWQETLPGGFHLATPAQPRVLQADRAGGRLAWSPAQGSLCLANAVLPSGWHLWKDSAGAGVTCTGMSKDGTRLLLSTREDLQVWDALSGLRLHRTAWPATFTRSWPWFIVNPDGTEVIVGDQDQPLHVIPVTAAENGTPQARLGLPKARGPGQAFYMIHGLGPAGEWVVCDGPSGRTVQRNRTFALWPDGDHTRAKIVARDIPASTMQVLGENGAWGLAASRNGMDCSLWDTRDGRSCGMLGMGESVTVTGSPDFRLGVLTGRSRTTLWEAQTQRLITSWSSPEDVAGTLPRFSPDSRQLAMHDRTGKIFLYNMLSGTPTQTMSIPAKFTLWDVQWSGTARLIAVGTDGRIGEWNLAETAVAQKDEGLAE